MLENSIGKIKIRINGQPCEVELLEDGRIVLPDGSIKTLPVEKFEAAKEKIAQKQRDEIEARPLTAPSSDDFLPSPATSGNPSSSTPTGQQLMRYEASNHREEPQIAATLPEEEGEKTAEVSTNHPAKKEKKPRRSKGNTLSESTSTPPHPEIHRTKKEFPRVLLVLLPLLLVGALFFAGWSLGFVTINFSGSVAPPEYLVDSGLNPLPDAASESSPMLNQASPVIPPELDEAKTIIVVARLVTPEGEEKEVVLGYFTTEDDAMLPVEGEDASDSLPAVSQSAINSPKEPAIGQVLNLSIRNATEG